MERFHQFLVISLNRIKLFEVYIFFNRLRASFFLERVDAREFVFQSFDKLFHIAFKGNVHLVLIRSVGNTLIQLSHLLSLHLRKNLALFFIHHSHEMLVDLFDNFERKILVYVLIGNESHVS